MLTSNTDLFNAQLKLYGDVLAIANRVPEGDLPVRRVVRIRREGPHSESWVETEEVDRRRMALIGLHQLEGSEAWNCAVEEFESDSTVQTHLNRFVAIGPRVFRISTQEALQQLMVSIIEAQPTHRDVDTSSFEAVYLEFEEYFRSEQVKVRALAPLGNFSTSAPSTSLRDDLQIVRLSMQEREMFLTERFGSSFGDPWSGHDAYAIDFALLIPKAPSDNYPVQGKPLWEQVGRYEIERTLSALRLFRPGAVGVTQVRFTVSGWQPHGRHLGTTTLPYSRPLGPSYEMTAEEAVNFGDFWRWFIDVGAGTDRRLMTALARLNAAFDRTRPEDRIVDLVVALEALLLRDSDRGAAYRLALRGGALLGHEPQIRREACRRLKSSYSVRSRIVHGGDPDEVIAKVSQASDLAAFLASVEHDTRRAIVEYLGLRAFCGGQDVLSTLDKWIEGGEHHSYPRLPW